MPAPKPRLSTVFEGFRDPMVVALGLSQTIGYGTLYYAYGVLVPAMAVDFNVSIDIFFLVFTFGLLIGGLISPAVGRQIDRRGAQPIMIAGSAAASAALLVCAFSPNIWVFGMAVVLMEIAACMVLYEAAFAALTQAFQHQARSRITAITLIAGFASTLFWPLTQTLLDQFDWRITWAIFAGLNITFCLSLHALFLSKAKPVPEKTSEQPDDPAESRVLGGETRQRAIILYATAICVSGIIFASLPLHMLTLISSGGFSATDAALIAMFMGPCQVLARIAEILVGPRFDAVTTGRVSLFALPLALLALLAAGHWPQAAILFAGLYGVSQGLISIARGTVPLQLFGVRGYATLQGRITGLRFLLNAGAPAALAFLITRFGTNWAIAVCLVISIVSALAFFALPRANVAPTEHRPSS